MSSGFSPKSPGRKYGSFFQDWEPPEGQHAKERKFPGGSGGKGGHRCTKWVQTELAEKQEDPRRSEGYHRQ